MERSLEIKKPCFLVRKSHTTLSGGDTQGGSHGTLWASITQAEPDSEEVHADCEILMET